MAQLARAPRAREDGWSPELPPADRRAIEERWTDAAVGTALVHGF